MSWSAIFTIQYIYQKQVDTFLLCRLLRSHGKFSFSIFVFRSWTFMFAMLIIILRLALHNMYNKCPPVAEDFNLPKNPGFTIERIYMYVVTFMSKDFA